MQVTGSYNNYLTMTSLLAPLGVSGSGSLVMQVFTSALNNLKDKIDDQTFTEESQAALNQLYDDVSSLASEAKPLTLADYASVFHDRTATSSNTGVLTAEATDAFSADSGATTATYRIRVTQLAQAQENTGSDLDRDAPSTIAAGISTFTIHIGGQNHELGVTVAEGDTNEQVLQKIALAVNEADIGISAGVTDGGEEGTGRLTLSTDATGADSAFTITDISGFAIALTGAGTVSQEARDAAYSVDGDGGSASSNSICLDEGMVTVTLRGTGESVLTIAPDDEMISDAVTDFISGLHSFTDNLEENSDYIRDEVLASVNSFISGNESGLASIGITRDNDGRLLIDEDRLAAVALQDPDAVEEVFNGLDGLAVQVTSYASQIATASPLNYAKEAEGISTEFADYIYGTSAGLLQQMLTGSMLDVFA